MGQRVFQHAAPEFDKLLRDTWAKRKHTGKRPCCRQRANMKYAIGLNKHKDQVVLQCTVCRTIHRHMLGDDGKLFSDK